MSIKLTRAEWRYILKPGIGIKRWVISLFFGITLAGLGFAFLLRTLYITQRLPAIVYLFALSWLPDWVRGFLLLGCGLGLSLYGAWQFNLFLMSILMPGQKVQDVLMTLVKRQQRRAGPKIVTIGGGTGMSQLLRGLRVYTDNITAIVTVADDGGSSGKLRKQMRILPPGDFRNNIAALSEAEGLMTRLFQYRFPEFVFQQSGGQDAGEALLEGNEEMLTEAGTVSRNGAHPPSLNGSALEKSGLGGHSFGNLFIAAMSTITGSFETAIAESSRVLAVRGRILPCTLEEVTLCAEVHCQRTTEHGETLDEWRIVEGESDIPDAGGRIERVFLKPENPRAYPEAIRAILQADLIVAGPGSFFTSVMPNLLVPAVRDALAAAPAQRIYLCNLVTQPGETDGYTVSEHMRQLQQHVGDIFQIVIANDNYDLNRQHSATSHWVTLPAADEHIPYRLFTGDLTDAARPWRHDARKLAARLMEVYFELMKE